jgi:transposase-like protein
MAPKHNKAIHVTCPKCHSPNALRAFEQRGSRRHLCPLCWHVWDTLSKTKPSSDEVLSFLVSSLSSRRTWLPGRA